MQQRLKYALIAICLLVCMPSLPCMHNWILTAQYTDSSMYNSEKNTQSSDKNTQKREFVKKLKQFIKEIEKSEEESS